MRNTVRCGLVALGLLLLIHAHPAAAQTGRTAISAWGGLFLDPGDVADDESATRWDFGTSFAAGGGIEHRLGRSLILGLEVGYAPMNHEVVDLTADAVVAEGRAHLLTSMATGRLGGGGGDFFTYLAGGIGAVTYGIPHLERWDSDFSFRVGAGLQYQLSQVTALYVEWNRWRALHQTEGVDDNTVRHSSLQAGIRYGL